jgi:CTP synthase (UTP-ammonia lyase)
MGKITAIRFAREHKIPFLGIRLGLQLTLKQEVIQVNISFQAACCGERMKGNPDSGWMCFQCGFKF